MAKRIVSKRVKFLRGKQRLYLNKCQKKLDLRNKQLAALLKISVRTFTDWKREKFLLPLSAVQILSTRSNVSIPRNILIKNEYWYIAKSSRMGGLAAYKKYGYVGCKPERRKQEWFKWWESYGKFIDNPIFRTKNVYIPKESSKLAELTGIILGDGGINKYQIKITLNSITDKEYIKFVIKLLVGLFNINPSISERPKYHTIELIISRKKLVEYCEYKLGVKIGNKIKQNIDIPKWIKRDKKFQIACLRGLIDTDGCIFTHTYKVNKKIYTYKKLAFTSYSQALRTSVYEIMKSIELKPRLSRQRDVRLDSINDLKNYFLIVGSHNPKHLKRYYN